MIELFNAENVGASRSHIFEKGTQLYDFNFLVPPECPESVEGMHLDPSSEDYGYCRIVYTLQVMVERPFSGTTRTQTLANSHIWLIRTIPQLDPEINMAIDMDVVHESVWNNKISYRVVIPQSRFVYGSSVTAQLALTPLRKGVQIQRTTMELIEEVVAVSSELIPYKWTLHPTRVVVPFNASSARLVNPNSADLVDEAFRFPVTLPLPQSLVSCRPTMASDRCKIFHSVKLVVDILNPDGHVSQLTIRVYIRLYIPPSLEILDDQSVAVSASVVDAIPSSSATQGQFEAPPEYGQHQLDLLYDNVGSSGMVTPSAGIVSDGLHPPLTSTMSHSSDFTVESTSSSDSSSVHSTDLPRTQNSSDGAVDPIDSEEFSHQLNISQPDGLSRDRSSTSQNSASADVDSGHTRSRQGSLIHDDTLSPLSPSASRRSQDAVSEGATTEDTRQTSGPAVPTDPLGLSRPRAISIPHTIHEAGSSRPARSLGHPTTGPISPPREWEYDILALSKTPSYEAAVTNPCPLLTPRTDIPGGDLPLYDDIVPSSFPTSADPAVSVAAAVGAQVVVPLSPVPSLSVSESTPASASASGTPATPSTELPRSVSSTNICPSGFRPGRIGQLARSENRRRRSFGCATSQWSGANIHHHHAVPSPTTMTSTSTPTGTHSPGLNGPTSQVQVLQSHPGQEAVHALTAPSSGTATPSRGRHMHSHSFGHVMGRIWPFG